MPGIFTKKGTKVNRHGPARIEDCLKLEVAYHSNNSQRMKPRFTDRKLNSACKRATYLYHRAGASLGTAVGISGQKGKPERIVSLTTIPERIGEIHVCIDSLLRQSLKPDMVLLWLNMSEVSGRPVVRPDTLPRSLTRLVDRGLTIDWCPNIGPYCKLVPTLRKYPEATVVTADDDICYPSYWLQELVEAKNREPQYVHCHRAHRMTYGDDGALFPYNQWETYAEGHFEPSFDIFPTGVGGVIYAPGDLHPDVLDEKAFLELCPKADDIWFKAMSLRNGVMCKRVPGGRFKDYRCSMHTCRKSSLRKDNVHGGGNDEQIQRVAGRYGVFGPHRD